METYFSIGILMGMVLVAEGLLLLRSGGKLDLYTGITSTIEFIWLITTVYVLFTYDLSTMGLAAASAYVSYNIIVMLNSRKILRELDSPEDAMTLQIPLGYAYAGMGFGVFYSIACMLAL